LVLVHGSGQSLATWDAQQGLADRFTLVVVARSGYPPTPPLERIDFEAEARELMDVIESGDHLLGSSYGGIACLYAAARHGALGSLTVIEPPALGLARGRDDVDAVIDRLTRVWNEKDPRAFAAGLAEVVMGQAPELPDPLPAERERIVRAVMAERPPWEADPPLDDLASAAFPKLVVSGAHNPAFDAVCDVLEERLEAERFVVPGAGHAAHAAPGFNDVLLDFLARAQRD
jgi:pimeloyl-ACP methyl ester carboxylesterase